MHRTRPQPTRDSVRRAMVCRRGSLSAVTLRELGAVGYVALLRRNHATQAAQSPSARQPLAGRTPTEKHQSPAYWATLSTTGLVPAFSGTVTRSAEGM